MAMSVWRSSPQSGWEVPVVGGSPQWELQSGSLASFQDALSVGRLHLMEKESRDVRLAAVKKRNRCAYLITEYQFSIIMVIFERCLRLGTFGGDTDRKPSDASHNERAQAFEPA